MGKMLPPDRVRRGHRVMHSLTKWIGGHGRVVGVLVDAGRFDWRGSERHKTLIEPYDGDHGLNFADDYGPAAFIIRARVEGLRDFGPALPASSASTILLGVETLGPRMDRHVGNARAVVAALRAHEGGRLGPSCVAPGPSQRRSRQAPHAARSGSIVTFGICGGRNAATRFIESLKLASHLANVGDAKTLVLHPASTTHAQLDEAALAAAGIGEDLIRLSIGIEDAADIVADLEQALKRSQPSRKGRHIG
jgi:O-acetylhomoserine (thiol)-lyase